MILGVEEAEKTSDGPSEYAAWASNDDDDDDDDIFGRLMRIEKN